MEYGICGQAVVPVRLQPGDHQEMVNQLLFGDLVVIKGSIKDWILVETFDDQYEGWIDSKQIELISKDIFNDLISTDRFYALGLANKIISEDGMSSVMFTIGSRLPDYNEKRFSINNNHYHFQGEVQQTNAKAGTSRIIEIAKKYLEAPYLWGGRSPFGIDCSGFVQVVYKMCGIFLPRDSSQQVLQGENINFIHEALQGDLAFFGNEEGQIIHVGILLDNQQIIHASGKVRIDKIDHQGIFNTGLGKYTHQLRIIKRLNS
jgi:hypothetical protein